MFHASLALVLVFRVFQPAQAQESAVVDLGYAQYQGVFDGTTNVTSFLGIRYAAAPVGDLRWQGPSSPSNQSGLQRADTEQPWCPQAGQGTSPSNPFLSVGSQIAKRQTIETSEDCLFLNVFYPGATVSSESSPVIVWIHGGGYIGGFASGYEGSDLISQSNDGVVVVVIQYRLGLFGFLSGNEVHANGALNAGLLDQNFALRWVNRHISKFGGDPAQVTIWGLSAGAGSVLQHIIAENGQTSPQLFRGAITSSTFLPSQYGFNDTIPQALYHQVVDSVNCTTAQDTLACLRKADTTALQTANTNINLAAFFGTFAFVPVVDGTFIKQRPIEALKEGKVNGEALLAVTNTNEGDLFVNQTASPLNASQYAAELYPELRSQDTAKIAQLYGSSGSAVTQENLIMGESIFICPSYYLLNAFQTHSYKGEYAVLPALHGGEFTLYWPSFGRRFGIPIPFNNTDFINAFAQPFINFAISLDPNAKVDPSNITPKWDLYSTDNTEMVFNKTAENLPDIHADTTNEALLERCRFWESVGALTGQ
ncbi:hypothetical protein V5O48_003457 [Marasmius crinis-equi]|uniref:Carboxylic ester hydrolase n=1 Tax=Marasmius crinis-equi TaxID=585013 RepID=A0ABR3FTN5_9AGAR